MDFKHLRMILIGLLTTALYNLDDKKTVEELDKTSTKLCDLWGIGTGVFLTKEEERQISIICAVLRELQSYID